MIVLTGATGQIGAVTLRSLLERGEAVRVVVRDPARLPADARGRADVVVGSHADRAVIDGALEGAEALFWLAPSDPTADSPYTAYVAASIPAADAVVRYHVPRVVTVSALGQEVQCYAGHVSASHVMDALFRSTGSHLRALSMPSYMDNLLRQRDSLSQGILTGTLPHDLRLPWVATRDVAAVAAGLLADRTWSGQETLEVMGPEDLSYDDIAAVLSRVLGREISYRQGERRAEVERLIGYGLSPAMAASAMAMDLAAERGLNSAARRTALTATPTTLREFAETVLKPALAP